MIIVFSGTGNSLVVAQELRSHIGGEVLQLEHELLLEPSKRVLEVPEGEDVVWAFPIYSWGLPPVVVDFLKRCKLKLNHEPRHFMVCTCGDDMGYADNQWRKLIGRRGWNPRGAFSVQMPNTYVFMKGFDVDTPEAYAKKMEAMPARVAEVAAAIKRGFADSDVVRGGMAWVKSAIVYHFFCRFSMSPRQFCATEACTSCGKCARSCPLGNINIENDQPKWGDKCAFCLRCYHVCPSHAVGYGAETEGKGQKKVF